MNIKPPVPIIKAIVVAAIIAVGGWIGLDLPREAVEESVDEQFEAWESEGVGEARTAAESAAADSAAVRTAAVTSVIDGDTIVVTIAGQEERVRLIGIDTPEAAGSPAGEQCYGAEATQRMVQLVTGQTVTLTPDPTQAERDQYDRLLAYVTLTNGLDVGQTLVTEGFARERTYAAAYRNQATYQAAMREAQAAGRGQWSGCR